MIHTLLYHQVTTERASKYSNHLSLFQTHLEYIKKNFRVILPQDKDLAKGQAICLTFDDATCDFYYYVYPLLKKYNLRAVLSVCPKYILDTTPMSKDERLALLKKPLFRQPSEAFCTYEELFEMLPFIEVASHSYSHANLTKSNIDLEKEVAVSKQILEDKLQVIVTTFVYPFGKMNTHVHKFVKKHYACIMRIGNALNFSFSNGKKLHYRMNADNLRSPSAIFSLQMEIKAFWNLLWNLIRLR